MLSIQFLGAAGTVTGSCYLVTDGTTKFLIDCGMFQGPDIESRNAEPWPFNAAEIDFVLLTHAHIDHSGLLPKLTRHGFRGQIYATPRTVAITNLLLLDSAKIQEINEAEGKILDGVATHVAKYYDTKDAEKTISMFRSADFNEPFIPVKGVKIEFIRAGHILGAASIIIEMDGKRFVFSGDIGRAKETTIQTFDPADKREVDFVVMESLYGGKEHPTRESSVYEMMEEVKETTRKGGNVMIAAFAVQRSQDLLLDFKNAKLAGALARDLPVYIDSPLAAKVTDIYVDAFSDLILDNARLFSNFDPQSPYDFPGMIPVRTSKFSRKLKSIKGAVIVAGSGMVNGGRILGHVVNHMTKPKNELILTGFQAEETYGRLLSEGAKELMIDGKPVTIAGKVKHLEGFSAHGDQSDLMLWLQRYNSPRLKNIMLVHTEADRAAAFSASVKTAGFKANIAVPQWREVIKI